jgi:hypothetical protein
MSVVVVSAYYKIPSKASHSFYVPHLQQLFRSISVPMIFFTTSDVRAEITSWGYPMDNIRFVELPLNEFTAWKKFDASFWQRQKQRDPEKYHTPELGAVWFEKKEFVKRAISMDESADIFIWLDAGFVRSDKSEASLKMFGKRHFPYDNRLLLNFIENGKQHTFYRYPYICIGGGSIAGKRHVWLQHSDLYDNVLQEYDANGVCAMSDQYIMKSCADKNPSLYHLYPANPNDKWFHFIDLL